MRKIKRSFKVFNWKSATLGDLFVNKVEGNGRDAERFITGDDESIYYTKDHYDTFIKLK